MIQYTEYWPAFFDREDDPIKGEVETLDELLEVPFIKDKTQTDTTYSLATRGYDNSVGQLMREYPDGKFFVVAMLESEDGLSSTDKIPQWLYVEPTPIINEPKPWEGAVTPLDDLLASGVVKITK